MQRQKGHVQPLDDRSSAASESLEGVHLQEDDIGQGNGAIEMVRQLLLERGGNTKLGHARHDRGGVDQNDTTVRTCCRMRRPSLVSGWL